MNIFTYTFKIFFITVIEHRMPQRMSKVHQQICDYPDPSKLSASIWSSYDMGCRFSEGNSERNKFSRAIWKYLYLDDDSDLNEQIELLKKKKEANKANEANRANMKDEIEKTDCSAFKKKTNKLY